MISDLDIIMIGGSVIALLFLLIFVLFFRIEARLRKMFRGTKMESIEDALALVQKATHRLDDDVKKMFAHEESMEKRLKQSVQGVGTVRFNPFQGTSGSNQSFATAFLNEQGDGVVLSSIYSRERISVFAKPIKNLRSEYELSDEEKEAIIRAKSAEIKNEN